MKTSIYGRSGYYYIYVICLYIIYFDAFLVKGKSSHYCHNLRSNQADSELYVKIITIKYIFSIL